nr:DUF3343 domain-containing protein [uncultured Fretibacterium sp.]
MSESTGARHYVLFPDVKNAQSLYALMKAAGVRCTFAPTPREADRCCGLAVLYQDADERGRIERMAAENGVQVLRFFDGAAGDPERMKFC